MTTRLEKMHEQIEKIHKGDVDHVNADILHRYIDVQEGNLTTARANESAWEATAQGHYEDAQTNKKAAAEMQLIAGRYQYQFEQAMKCINSIDDMFEYRFRVMSHDALQREVRVWLKLFTDAVKPKGK